VPVPGAHPGAEVRQLDIAADRAAVAALLLDVWLGEDPYRSLTDPRELLSSEIERSLNTAESGAVAIDADGVCAVALVHADRCAVPTLTWLTVARTARERGLATALLALITDALRARGISELASAASAANTPSLRWHLTRGFQLAEDQLREALRERPR
jgi:GNAT superfamily N-acetyltransferase